MDKLETYHTCATNDAKAKSEVPSMQVISLSCSDDHFATTIRELNPWRAALREKSVSFHSA